jgi:hypothetical protein
VSWRDAQDSPCRARSNDPFSGLDKSLVYPILLFVTWLMGHDYVHYFESSTYVMWNRNSFVLGPGQVSMMLLYGTVVRVTLFLSL